jgi:hypothetical protein
MDKARWNMRCALPNIERHGGERNRLEKRLCDVFGGFTSVSMRGGWNCPDTGRTMIEAGIVYDVSFEAGRMDLADMASRIYQHAGYQIGEDMVHIERSVFVAHHRQGR